MIGTKRRRRLPLLDAASSGWERADRRSLGLIVIELGLAITLLSALGDVLDMQGRLFIGWKQQLGMLFGFLVLASGVLIRRTGTGPTDAATRASVRDRGHARRLTVPRWPIEVLAITAAAALLRFATLDVQSFWYDETITVRVLELSFSDMLKSMPDRTTPILYYIVAWPWFQLFGTGEVGLRSLSALVGAATVPISYLAGRTLVSRRVGVIAAALTAVSPLLIWYGQEARTYALFTMLGALSFLFFARALEEPRARDLGLWALTSALALATHYFALFLVVPEALWLLASSRGRRTAVGAAVGSVALAGALLAPLALHQATDRGGPEWLAGSSPLLDRARVALEAFLIHGVIGRLERPSQPLASLVILAAILVGASVWVLLRRGQPGERRGARVAAGIGGMALLIPLALALVGSDYVLHRNLIGAWVPLAVAVAAGFGVERARRVGFAATLAYCALALVLVVSIQLTADYQRDNWRGIARAAGPVPDQRAVLISQRGRRQPRPPAQQAVRPSFFTPFEFYRREVAKGGRIIPYPEAGALIREIVVVDLRVSPRPFVGGGPPGFRAVESRKGHGYSLVRLRSQRPRIVPAGLVPRAPGSLTDDKPPLVFLETPSGRQRADRAQ